MILADASGLYALADRDDASHTAAKGLHETERGKELFATSALLLAEVWYLIENRAGFKSALLWWESVMVSPVEILPLEQNDLMEALKIQQKYRDQDFGLVDSTTFALCEKHRISQAFTFDRRHFSAYRPSFTSRLHLLP